MTSSFLEIIIKFVKFKGSSKNNAGCKTKKARFLADTK